MPIAERLAAQLLSGPPACTPEAVAERLLAVQAQDLRGARLAIRSRSTGLTAADIDRALTDDRSLLVTWLNRGTLHLVRSEDYPWLQQVTTPQLVTANTRRLGQVGVTPAQAERAAELIAGSLADDGPQTRDELRTRLDAARIPVAGQALVHLLMVACLRGLTVRGPIVGREQAYVLVRDWLPRTRPVDRGAALADLARRYLAGHAPANERDLAKWGGLPLRDARAGFDAIAREFHRRPDGLVGLAGTGRRRALPPPKLLGPFDPLLLGWCSRDPIVGPHEGIVTVNGLFRPFALVRGRAVATWSLAPGGPRLAPLEPLEPGDLAALEADAADVRRFLEV